MSMLPSILRDEDFVSLMAHPEGLSAFGMFCVVVTLGKDRRSEGRTERSGHSLLFKESTEHLCKIASIEKAVLGRAIEVLNEVAKSNGNPEWLLFGPSGKLIIRTYYKNSDGNGDNARVRINNTAQQSPKIKLPVDTESYSNSLTNPAPNPECEGTVQSQDYDGTMPNIEPWAVAETMTKLLAWPQRGAVNRTWFEMLSAEELKAFVEWVPVLLRAIKTADARKLHYLPSLYRMIQERWWESMDERALKQKLSDIPR